MKNRTIENIEDDIKQTGRKRDLSIIDADKHQKKLVELMDEYYAISPDYTKIICLTCGGVGYLQGEDKKKHICKNEMMPTLSCAGKQYIWMKRYKE